MGFTVPLITVLFQRELIASCFHSSKLFFNCYCFHSNQCLSVDSLLLRLFVCLFLGGFVVIFGVGVVESPYNLKKVNTKVNWTKLVV